MNEKMDSGALRDQVAGAMRSTTVGSLQDMDPFIVGEEVRAALVPSGHHGYYSGDGGDYTDRGCFAIRGGVLTNCYFWNGSQAYELPEMRIGTSLANSLLGIIILPDNDTEGKAEYIAFSSLDKLNELAKEPDTVVIPLYRFGANSNVITDFRNMPRGDSWGIVI